MMMMIAIIMMIIVIRKRRRVRRLGGDIRLCLWAALPPSLTAKGRPTDSLPERSPSSLSSSSLWSFSWLSSWSSSSSSSSACTSFISVHMRGSVDGVMSKVQEEGPGTSHYLPAPPTLLRSYFFWMGKYFLRNYYFLWFLQHPPTCLRSHFSEFFLLFLIFFLLIYSFFICLLSYTYYSYF